MIKLRVTSYFKPSPVLRAWERKRDRLFRIAGARTRLIARRKIKKQTKNWIPQPGSPPRSPNPSSSKYRRGLFYAIDQRTNSVVIGPAVFEGENTASAFEEGGIVTIKTRKGRRVRARMRKFPVMGPTANDAVPYYGGLLATINN